MTPSELIIVGGGGHGRVVADAARASGLRPVAFADSSLLGREIGGLRVVPSEVSDIARLCGELEAAVVIAIGDNAARKRLQIELVACGVPLASVVHPSAVVLGGATLGQGVMVLARAVVGVDCRIGDGCIINTAATIDHDCVVGAYAHLSPGVHTGGGVRVDEGAHLAVGVSVRNGVSVGAWSVVGVGAAVVSDIGPGVVAYGLPARVVRQIER